VHLRDGEQMSYDLAEHRHRFAVWAAARASQRGFTTVGVLREALRATDIREVASNPRTQRVSAVEFDALHRKWCAGVCKSLKRSLEKNSEKVTYGRAAKLVAVYLKSTVILGDGWDSSFGRNLHPPIDRILLQSLARSTKITSDHQGEWRSISWTQLDDSRYYKLIGQLRDVMPPGAPFWTIEEYWEPSEGGDD
jgi:hypothetical protein